MQDPLIIQNVFVIRLTAKEKSCAGYIYSVSIQKILLLSLDILWPFLVIFLPQKYLSQNLGADCHFVVLNLSKSELDRTLQHKSKTFLFPLFSILEEKILKIYDSKMGNFLSFLVFFCQLHENLSQNWGSDGYFEMLNLSKS